MYAKHVSEPLNFVHKNVGMAMKMVENEINFGLTNLFTKGLVFSAGLWMAKWNANENNRIPALTMFRWERIRVE